MRHLIINGDDLGLCNGVNRAIFALHELGMLSSASLMVSGEKTLDAIELVKAKYPNLSLGLHLRFGEPPFKIDKLVEEMSNQWKKFYQLVGKSPTHVDIHRYPSIALQISRFLPERVPMRNVGSIHYIDKFNGNSGEDGVTPANLIKILKRIKKGIYELSCQPSYEPIEENGDIEECGDCRELQLKTLFDERVRMIMEMRDISLISYNDVLTNDIFRIHTLERHYVG